MPVIVQTSLGNCLENKSRIYLIEKSLIFIHFGCKKITLPRHHNQLCVALVRIERRLVQLSQEIKMVVSVCFINRRGSANHTYLTRGVYDFLFFFF